MDEEAPEGDMLGFRRRVWVTLAFVMLGTLAAQLIVVAFLYATGTPLSELSGGMPDLAPWQYLVMLALSQLLSYLLPGLLAARALFGRRWYAAAGLLPYPSATKLAVGVLIFIGTLAFTGYLAQLNASLDLSDWQAEIEGNIAQVLADIITGTSPGQFALVLVAVAVLPAVGEELVFRGLLQPAFIRMTGSAHFGIWLTALFFGLVHLQFAGILPRVFLGAVLGFLAYRSQRLWVPIVAHALFNGAQAVAARLGSLDVVLEEGAKVESPDLLWGAASVAAAAAALHFGLPHLAPRPVPPPVEGPAA